MSQRGASRAAAASRKMRPLRQCGLDQTPPLGENLFAASGIGGETVEKIVVRVPPFVAVSTATVFLIAFVPKLSLWLPKQMGY